MKGVFYRILVLFVCLLFCAQASAQSTSNRGNNFWIAYAGHIDALTSRMTLFLSSDVNTSYEVKANGITIAQGNIIANIVTPVFINPNDFDVYIGTSDVKEVNKGINVITQEAISLYCVISNNARTGSSLILPTSTLGQEYYVFSQQNKGTTNATPYSEFTIVATKDGTIVEITPKHGNRNGNRAANVPFQVTLNKGDVYQYQAVNDLTGSYVKTLTGCTPIAVFSGNTWAAYCELGNSRTPNGGDNIYQQLFPVTAWGKNFVSAPFYNTQNGNTDIIKIIVSEDNTTVNVNGSTANANGTSLSNPYPKGSVITFYTNAPSIIKATSPVAVAQYQTSQTCNLANSQSTNDGGPFLGDPEMTVLNPNEQTLRDITVYSRLNSVDGVNTNIGQYYLNVILKTVDAPGFKLDGGSILSMFKPIADGEYSYAVINVTNAADQHRLTGTGGFMAIAYGYGRVESYAYLAGTDLKNLKSNIEVFSSGADIAKSNFCLGTSFDFVLKLPYVTEKITWSLNNGTHVDVSNSPVYTTVVEDGLTYYLYRYALASNYFAGFGTYNLKATIQKAAASICAEDEEVITSFDVFAPAIDAPSTICINTVFQLSDVSPTSGGNIKSWNWEFGDGTSSSSQNPKHKYMTSGLKTVKLTVVTDLGCTLTTTKVINVLPSPKSAFTTTGALCVNSQIQFNNQSSHLNTDIASQMWDFGNGERSNLASPSVTYTVAGTYNVQLISISSSGCADTVTKSLVINDFPEISFKDPGACVGDLIAFESSVIKGNIATWFWDFGDGSNNAVSNSEPNPKHKYAYPGTYRVSLTVTSTEGCSASFTKDIVVSGPNPIPAFEVVSRGNLCANNEIMFKNNSTIAIGQIRKLEWIFDYQDGTSPVSIVDTEPTLGKAYAYKYPNLPLRTDYKVVLRAYSGNSCFVESAPIIVSVNPAPIITLDSVSPLCEAGDPIKIRVSDANNVVGSYEFFGPGVSSDGVFDPRINGVGLFNIRCIFTSDKGCVEEKDINITVDRSPQVSTPEEVNILLGGQKQINVSASGSNLSVKWTPSIGLSADDVLNPIVKIDRSTLYTVTITSNSCVIEEQIWVKVHDKPSIPNVFSPNGDGKNDTWNIKYLDTYVNADISIFNRYGQQVFSASPYNTPWDGRFNGSDLPVGVYYFIIDPKNGQKKYTGSVTILR
jgi:gliding motility-associated-like protein